MTLSKITPMASAAAIACLCLNSCSTTSASSSRGSGMATYNAYDRPATLPTNPSNVHVKVSLSKQMIYVMEGSKALLVTPASVGTRSTPTPRGSFRIFKKDHYHRANSHGFAYSGGNIKKCYISSKPRGWSFKGTPMPYWCEFKANYGIHAGWMKDRPCTHGCIRLHVNVAPKFYRLVSNGTKVSIAQSQPEDATIGRNIPRPPDAGPLPDYPGALMLDQKIFTMHKTPKYN
jgi:hypothetical protein